MTVVWGLIGLFWDNTATHLLQCLIMLNLVIYLHWMQLVWWKKIFLIQVTNQTLCSHCNNTVVSKSSIFLLYITPLNLFQNQSFENCISGSILPNSWRLYSNFCQKDSGVVSMLRHFVLLPTFLIVELSSNCIDQIFFPMTMDVWGQHYVPNCT